MKAHIKHLTTAGIMALIAMRAQAIEAPADDSPPPQVATKLQSAEASRTPSAFAGIVADDIPEVLADHIGINPGDGILVKAVMPDGPAAKAGIRNNDVITQIGDKTMHSPEDLTRMVSTQKPGDTLRFKMIQHGKPSEVSVQLEGRPETLAFQQPQSKPQSQPLDRLKFDDVPSDITDRMRGMIEENLKNFASPFKGFGHLGMDQEMEQRISEMRKQMQMSMDDIESPNASDSDGIHFQQNATIKMLDQDGSVEIQSKNDSHEVTVRDKDHKVLWSGPWNNDKDKASAPDEIRARVDRLNLDTSFNGSGFRLRMSPKATIDN